MAYDAEATTAPNCTPSIDQLRGLTPAKALALYQLANATRVPIVQEIATHALAGALEAALADLATLRANPPAPEPSEAISPPEAVHQESWSTEPTTAPEIITTAPEASEKPKRQSARVKAAPVDVGPDLAAPQAMPPKSKRGVGAFHCVWADGSATFVSGVIFNASKPDTRWAAAFQAADRLRRARARHAYAESLNTPSAVLVGRYETLGDLKRETPAWWDLVKVRPMPALLAVVADSGETFEPAGTFGAGDLARTRELEAQVVAPINPAAQSALRAQGQCVWTGGDGLPVYGDAKRAAQFPTGWTPQRCYIRRLEALEAWPVEIAPQVVETAREGAAVAGTPMAALEGAQVVIRRAKVECDVVRARKGEIEGRDSLQPLLGAAGQTDAPTLYTLSRGAGGFTFALTRTDGHVVRFGADRLPYLAHAA